MANPTLIKDICEALNMSRPTLKNHRDRGMPVDSVDSARKWYAENVNTTAGRGSVETHDNLNALRSKLVAAQTRELDLKSQLKEFEVRVAREQLVSLSKAYEVIKVSVGPILQRLENMDAVLKVKCNPADPELAGEALRDWSRATRSLCEKALATAAAYETTAAPAAGAA